MPMKKGWGCPRPIRIRTEETKTLSAKMTRLASAKTRMKKMRMKMMLAMMPVSLARPCPPLKKDPDWSPEKRPNPSITCCGPTVP